MKEPEIQQRDWTVYDGEETDVGHILEVDLDYDDERLHIAHSSLPLAPHQLDIDEPMLSPFAKRLLGEMRGAKAKGTERHRSTKLVGTFLPRRKYIVHSRNLALYLSLGMKLTKVHRVLEFRTSSFLRDYITFCTTKRKEAKTEFRKHIFKTFSNSVFGKFIENTRDHMQCKLVRTRKKMLWWASCPRYISFKKIAPQLYAVFLKPRKLVLRQCWAIGFTILDVAKSIVYDHFYNKIAPALGYKVSVAASDTDSLLLMYTGKMSKEEVYEALSGIMDFSNFPVDSKFYDASRMNELGYWKDEMRGRDIQAFAGVAAKSYALRVHHDDGAVRGSDHGSTRDVTKCKGIAKGVCKSISFDAWKDAVLAGSVHKVTQYTIASRNHKIRTVGTEKVAVSPFDDKRYINPCGIHTVPYGSYLIAMMEKTRKCPFCRGS